MIVRVHNIMTKKKIYAVIKKHVFTNKLLIKKANFLCIADRLPINGGCTFDTMCDTTKKLTCNSGVCS